jgi:hypothetical protein
VQPPDENADESQVSARRRLFGRLARAVADTSNEAPLPLRLCSTFVDIVGADGGAITLAYTEPERTTVCVTDPTADRIEDLQDVLGQGPGPHAYSSGRIVVATFPGDAGTRWPMLEKSIGQIAAPLAIHAIPMRVGFEVLGVVTVHRSDLGALDVPAAHAQFLADAVGAAIARESAQDSDAARWDARDRVHQATGMVVAQLRIEPNDALALIRAFAFSHSMSLDDVATEIIERRQEFSDNADFRGDEAR